MAVLMVEIMLQIMRERLEIEIPRQVIGQAL
jgi:uncharacterized protein (DUF2267 family)